MSNNEYDDSDNQSYCSDGNGSLESAPHFENVREENYSDSSSVMYNTSVYTDPAAKHRKSVRRIDPSTGKWVTVYMFPTSTTPNKIIRHAMSGSFQNNNGRACRVGTRDEDLFFSVMFATGELGQTGDVLFYDSPEQYEQHLFGSLSQETKANWRAKRDNALREISRKHNGYNVVVK